MDKSQSPDRNLMLQPGHMASTLPASFSDTSEETDTAVIILGVSDVKERVAGLIEHACDPSREVER